MSNARAQVEELIVEQVSELLEPLTLARSSSPSALELMGVASSEDRAEDQDISEWIGLVLDAVRVLKATGVPRGWADYVEYAATLGGFVVRIRELARHGAALENAVSELLSVLVSYWLRWRATSLFHVLDVLGIIRSDGDLPDGSFYPRPKFSIDVDNLRDMLEDPSSYLKTLLGLELSPADRRRRILSSLVPRLSRLLQSIGVRIQSNETGDRLDIEFNLANSQGQLSVLVGTDGSFSLNTERPASMRFSEGPWDLEFVTQRDQGIWRIGSRSTESGEALLSVGIDRVGLKLGGVALALAYGGDGRWSVEIELKRFSVELDPGSVGDSFVSTVSQRTQIDAQIELKFRLTSLGEFFVVGNGNGGARIPIRRNLFGAVSLDTLFLGCGFLQQNLFVQAGLDWSVTLGPLTLVIAGLGLRFTCAVPRSELSDFDAGVDVKPPDGIGITVKAAPVSGGGFIAYSDSTGRYTGALALTLGNLALRAIGVLDTRAPGVSGYSFLIIISAEFTPIQLGFGFTLNGVGGICGIQRSVSVQALQTGVRDGSLAPLLFARDPVGQASQLVTGLQRVFPPTSDRYVFGPMFKLGWGTPTLFTADVGLVLQLPPPIVIALLGTLNATFPKPEAAVVELHIDIAGVLDAGEKRLSIDASLRDSRVASFTLTGDMALRLYWGSEPDFALSVGGFNPGFRPPPSFPTLRRLAISMGAAVTRINLAAYLALTSNTLQIGARAELGYEAAGFNVIGYVEFHALFVFSPFSFRFNFAAGVALRRGTTVLAGLSVTGLIGGPRPWHISGSASITILFFDVSVGFDATFGDPPLREQIETIDVWAKLQPALQDVRNWSATLPAGRSRGVSVAADQEVPARVRLDPMSELAVRQKVLPLDRRITKLGEGRIAGPSRFRVSAVRVGANAAGSEGTVIPATAVEEPFAPGQYESLTDAQRLSSPSYEPMTAGALVQGASAQTGGAVPRTIQVRTIRAQREDTFPSASQRLQQQMMIVGASQLAAMRNTGTERYAPAPGASPMVALDPESWMIASTRNLSPETNATGMTWGAAAGALQQQLRSDPRQQGVWQVVPAHEARS